MINVRPVDVGGDAKVIVNGPEVLDIEWQRAALLDERNDWPGSGLRYGELVVNVWIRVGEDRDA